MRTWTSMVRVLCAIWLVASSIAFTVFQTQTVLAQQTAFLIPPFYGTKGISTYFDHNLPNYAINNTIALYDGRVAQPGNGVCGHNPQNQAYAYWTQPNATGECIFYEGHDGMDFNLNYERVLAAASGTVSFVGWANITCRTCTYGLYVEITHDNGYITRYGHLSAAAVSMGEYVSQGQVIGTSGNTGNSSGAHLHFGVMNQNRLAVDPSGWCQGCGADPWQTFSGATSWYMWVAGVTVGNDQVISSNVDPTYNPHNADCLSPAICVEDTANNSGGFRKGSGGPFNNVCQNDCGGWTSQTFTGFPAGLDGHSYYANTNYSGGSWSEWQPALPAPGPYEVWVYVPNQGATTYQAQYIINATDGQYSAYVDQYGLINQWVNIGVYHLMSGPAYVDTIDFTADPVQRLIGADAVKFVPLARYVSFQPDIKANNGWTTSVTVQNNSSSSANVYVSLLNSDSSYNCGTLTSGLSVNGNGTQSITTSCGGGTSTSAVIGSDKDISVVTTRVRSPAPYSSGAYVGLSGGATHLSNTFNTSTAFYVPVVLYQRNTASGLTTSDIIIQNADAVAQSVKIDLVPYPGSVFNEVIKYINLAPGASLTYTGQGDLPTQWYGSAVVSAVSAGKQIAVLSDLLAGSNNMQTINAFPTEGLGTTWYDSVFLSRVSGLTGVVSTPISIQNLNGNTIPVGFIQLTCQSNPANTVPPTVLTANNTAAVPNNASYNFNPVVDTTTFPTGWYGTCKITTNPYLVVTLMQERFVNQDNADSFQAHSAAGTAHSAFFPIIQKRLSNGSATSLAVQNLSASATAHVTFHYYADPGCSSCNNVTMQYSIVPGGAQYANHRLPGLDTGLPDGWFGSLMVTSSNQPIDGFNQLTNINNPSGDTLMAHGAITRP